MVAADAMQTVHEAVEAHGGCELWNSIEALEAEVSARGFLFTAKHRPALSHVRMRAATREPRFSFFDFPKPGQRAELIGNDEVRILDSAGRIVAKREHPRAAFRGFRRLFFWDDLDFTYFGGYATWNYLTTPFLLLREGFIIANVDLLPGTPASFARLQVTFPDDIPTHSRRQIFTFDDRRLLHRLDYTAEVVGGWARAAHLCDEYRLFGGINAPTRRRVLPLPFGNKPLPGPTLVALEIHDIKPIPASINPGRPV
jgi:hypothetical protein